MTKRWHIVLTVTESGNSYPLPQMHYWLKWRARMIARAMTKDLAPERMTVSVRRAR